MKCSTLFMGSRGNQCCRFICLAAVLLSLSCFRGPISSRNLFNQAEATLWPVSEHPAALEPYQTMSDHLIKHPTNPNEIAPLQLPFVQKARICFNSMSTSFQSECVYCDSRLYSSTITACTGQPFLANNVTQAQAFCIATACLQVPVLIKTEPHKVANNLLEHSTSKLNLFRLPLLFGAQQGNRFLWRQWPLARQHSIAPPSPALHPFPQLRLRSLSDDDQSLLDRDVGQLMGLLGGSGNLSMIVEPPTGSSASSGDDVMETSGQNEQQVSTPGPAGAVTNQPVGNPSSTVATTEGGATKATASTKVSTDPATTSPATTMPPRDTAKMVEFPNFNQMHAQIMHNSLANRRKLALWPFKKPIQNLWPAASNRQQSKQHLKSQTGKSPVVLGRRRRKRSLGLVRPLSLSLSKNKQKNQVNGTVTAQLNKSVNGTTVGNVAFVLNNPAAAYIWSNPLARVLTRNVPNKSLQWQFGRGGAATTAAAPAPAAAPRPAASGVIRGGQSANAQPVRPGVTMAQLEAAPGDRPTTSAEDSTTGSFVVPADVRRLAAG